MATTKAELKVKIESNLKELRELSQGLNLTNQQRKAYSTAESKATANLNAQDWKRFKDNFDRMVDILKRVAETGSKSVSDAVKKATEAKISVQKDIERLKDLQSSFQGRITKEGKLYTKEAKSFYKESTKSKPIRDASGAIIEDRNNVVEYVQKFEEKLQEAFQKTGMTIQKITNDWLKQNQINFADINSAKRARSYVANEEKYRLGLVSERADVTSQLAKQEQSLPQLEADIAKLNEVAEKSANGGLDQLYTKIMQLSDETYKTVNAQSREEKARAREAEAGGVAETPELPKTLDKQTTSLGKAFKAFSIYAIVLRSVRRAAKEALDTIKQLDKSLTEQAMVTGKTREQTYKLLESYQQLASQLGATTKEVAEVSTQFLRQGKSTEESLKLTEAAIAAAKVAGIQAIESVNYLTTALNGFQLSASDAMEVSDKFAAVAANAAVSYDEIAIALSKVAAQANLAGMSIDYTTALLAKGIETTREAPETIGTALKTVIARMREMSDYGETLTGDTDVNNVETQLAYVGIELKNVNGELRSTEEVLNELGAKWTELNTNQQAAIAKALAGTRQQSRLIAMMTDYERTLELQEISVRSAGATMAQMATYMEGMDAAMNKVRIAWEEIISGITNTDAIINIVNGFAKILDFVGKILESRAGIILLVGGIFTLTSNIVAKKVLETKVSKQQYQISLQQQKTELQKLKTVQQQELAEKNVTKQKLLQIIASEGASAEAKAQAQIQLDALNKEIAAQQLQITNLTDQETLLNNQLGLVDKIQMGFGSWTMPVMAFISVLSTLKAKMTMLHKQRMQQDAQETASKTKLSALTVMSQVGIWAPIALSVLFGAIGIVSAISNASGEMSNINDQVKSMSANIYKLNNEASSVSSIASQFDKFDSALVKSNDDLKKMKELLDSATDKLSDEKIKKNQDIGFGKGKSARDYYESFSTTEGRRFALSKIAEVDRARIREEYKKQLRILNSNTAWLTGTNIEDATMREAVRKANNAFMYETIDALKQEGEVSEEAAQAIETMTQSLLENMDIQEAFGMSADGNGDKIAEFTRKIAEANVQIGNATLNIAEVLGNQDYSLREQVEAFKAAKDYLGEYSLEYKSLVATYHEFAYFSEVNADILDFLESVGMTTAELNDFYDSWKNLQKAGWEISQEEWESNFEGMLQLLADTNGDINQVINTYYSEQVAQLRELYQDDEKFYKAYDALINSFANAVEVGVLNMGQNLDKFANAINNFYDKAANWGGMNQTEKTQFLSDYAEFFAGSTGGALLEAFQNGNYNLIEEALKNNEGMQRMLTQRLAEIEQDLLIEEARQGTARNEAYITYLREWRDKLSDTTELFRADLQVLIDQEQAQLNIYKEYLQSQQQLLEDSLNQRKEAYEKYFEAINKEAEAADYEEQADVLMTNLTRLSTSSDATSSAQRRQLEEQLRTLEEERQKTLRENAQQAVLDSMSSTIEEINEKFDRLLESNQLLLEAMRGEISADGQGFLTNILTSALRDGQLTNYEAENFVQELRTAFSSSMSGIDWDNISARTENNQLILNVNGQEVYVDSANSATLYQEILAALVKAGYGK